jgi:hypothetical protein
MESIKELREICQDTRPSIYRDFLSQFYYKVSIYITWVLLKLGLSANQVTVLSGLIAFIGGLLVGSSNSYITLLGACFFHLFAILDMCDGEVARYRSQGGVNGHYLDWYMHFITSTSMVIGLFIGSSHQLQHPALLILSLVAVVTPIMDKSIQNAGWTVICWTRMRDLKNGLDRFPKNEQATEEIQNSDTKKRLPKPLRIIRFFALSPFQERWISIIMVILPSLDIAFKFLELSFIPYKFLLLLYMGMIGPIYLSFKVAGLVNGQGLLDGYQRITNPNRAITFPEDDFLS